MIKINLLAEAKPVKKKRGVSALGGAGRLNLFLILGAAPDRASSSSESSGGSRRRGSGSRKRRTASRSRRSPGSRPS